MRDLSAAHAEAFLEMMSAERGAAKNTLVSDEKDLDELSAFLKTRNTTLGAAGTADLQAFLGQMARLVKPILRPTARQPARRRCSRSCSAFA